MSIFLDVLFDLVIAAAVVAAVVVVAGDKIAAMWKRTHND